ncbi:helix-turn-helix domain-containing protein [Leucobacter komagatae]|uniref:helix-turn-helix domain-containing protein n=1 Tax=Leucobacter komagatae TaxID=55969 RepID=UPI001151E2AD
MALQIHVERTAAANARAQAARQKLSGREIARRLDFSPVYVSRRLSGEVEFSESDLHSFASVLGVTAATLLGETPE